MFRKVAATVLITGITATAVLHGQDMPVGRQSEGATVPKQSIFGEVSLNRLLGIEPAEPPTKASSSRSPMLATRTRGSRVSPQRYLTVQQSRTSTPRKRCRAGCKAVAGLGAGFMVLGVLSIASAPDPDRLSPIEAAAQSWNDRHAKAIGALGIGLGGVLFVSALTRLREP